MPQLAGDGIENVVLSYRAVISAQGKALPLQQHGSVRLAADAVGGAPQQINANN